MFMPLGTDDEKTSVSFSLAQPDSQNPFLLLASALPTMLPRLGQARTPHLTASLQQQVS